MMRAESAGYPYARNVSVRREKKWSAIALAGWRRFAMVERTQTGGWSPSLYEPIKKAAQTIADWFAPRSEAAVTGDAYEITMELAGVGKEDVEITVQGNMLMVAGEKRVEHVETTKSFLFTEREYGAFERAFRIPPDVDQDAIDADFANGVLRLKLPKVKPAESPAKKVEIRSS
jgi:HSP20 family protein